MYEVIFCDDDANFITYMKNMLSRGGLKAEEVHIHEYDTRDEFLKAMYNHAAIDLLFFDIQMLETDGNKIERKFREKFPESMLIFCSGKCKPKVNEIGIVPNLHIYKEYTEECMLEQIRKVIIQLRSKNRPPLITGRYCSNIVNLEPKEIMYISVVKHGSHIHIHPDIKTYHFGDKIKSKKKLHELYEILKNHGFSYAHNSYIVNLRYIKILNTTDLVIIDKTVLTIARSKRDQLLSAYTNWNQ